ncbi:MAG: hypothetical protein P1U64_00875 [Alcanivoracaceae bacterium]|nr:hypothetical protein [Alcanivoracaceae bacterium]
MLIKYLNDLDKAVKLAVDSPTPEQYHQCQVCVTRLEDYLDGQLEPLRRKGLELMGELLPPQFDEWMPVSRALHRSGLPAAL